MTRQELITKTAKEVIKKIKAITIKMDRKDIANSSFIMWQDRDKIINRGLKLSIVKHKDNILKYSDLVFF